MHNREHAVNGLKGETKKIIIWADSTSKTKTPFSIVYIHGFSSTRQETAPLCDIIAKDLGANLFYTRLTGHGLDGDALSKATVSDWFNDTEEVIEIGRRIGENVIIVGTSTGGTLATWIASKKVKDISALVLLSPNFGLKDKASEILVLPWAEVLATFILGKTYSWDLINPDHSEYWTTNYPTKALIPMMGLVDLIRNTDVSTITIPVFTAYSSDDSIVDSIETEKTILRFGSDVIVLKIVENTKDLDNHIIAGDILAPDNTETLAWFITQFLLQNLDQTEKISWSQDNKALKY